jgi:hypothetical protein
MKALQKSETRRAYASQINYVIPLIFKIKISIFHLGIKNTSTYYELIRTFLRISDVHTIPVYAHCQLNIRISEYELQVIIPTAIAVWSRKSSAGTIKTAAFLFQSLHPPIHQSTTSTAVTFCAA